MGDGVRWLTHDADGLDAHLQQQIRAALEHREPLEPPPFPRLEKHEVEIHGALSNHFQPELAAASDDLTVHERVWASRREGEDKRLHTRMARARGGEMREAGGGVE